MPFTQAADQKSLGRTVACVGDLSHRAAGHILLIYKCFPHLDRIKGNRLARGDHPRAVTTVPGHCPIRSL